MKDSSKSVKEGYLTPGRRFAFTIIWLVLAVIAAEAGLRLVYFIMRTGDEKPVAKASLSPYRNKEWADQYFYEMHYRQTQYEPYYGWSLVEYHGDYINIDSGGLRKTWNPAFDSLSPPDTLYVFGGSTLWGTGARDDYTIPSFLSRLLNKNGQRIHVVNHGSSGYVFRQEVIRLMAALWAEHRPDYVIFCDGANDVYSAYQSGVAGTIQNVARTRERLQLCSAWQQFVKGTSGLLSEYSMIYCAARKLYAIIRPPERQREAAAGFTEPDLQKLSGEIRESIDETTQLVEYLAQEYDFEYLRFWQPVAFLEDSLNAEESSSDNRLADNNLGALFRYTNDSLPTDSLSRFFNITDVLADRSATFYIDFCHLCEEGNETVAQEIATIFEREILSNE